MASLSLNGEGLSGTPERMLLNLWKHGRSSLKIMGESTMSNRTKALNSSVIKFTDKREAVPLRTVIKEVLVDLYCRGVIPKSVAQNVFNTLKLKKY
jgi:hypothetical protein